MFKRRVGLALGSGSSRGLTHIGLIKVFEENEIPINYISGSSIGAVFAALYAAGYKGNDLEELVINFIKDPPFNLGIEPLRAFIIFIRSVMRKFGSVNWLKTPMGLIEWQPIYNYLEQLLGDVKFNQLNIPLMITSTDLVTGEGIGFVANDYIFKNQTLSNTLFFHNRRVVDAVIASILIPGIFIPFIYEGRVLVDGGVKNSVPVDLLSMYRPDIIIGVDLGFNNQEDNMIKEPISAALQTIDIMGQEIADLKLEEFADIIIRPDINNVDIGDINCVKKAIEIGRRTARAKLPEIKRKLGR